MSSRDVSIFAQGPWAQNYLAQKCPEIFSKVEIFHENDRFSKNGLPFLHGGLVEVRLWTRAH